jgi:hypothetical protein
MQVTFGSPMERLSNKESNQLWESDKRPEKKFTW